MSVNILLVNTVGHWKGSVFLCLWTRVRGYVTICFAEKCLLLAAYFVDSKICYGHYSKTTTVGIFRCGFESSIPVDCEKSSDNNYFFLFGQWSKFHNDLIIFLIAFYGMFFMEFMVFSISMGNESCGGVSNLEHNIHVFLTVPKPPLVNGHPLASCPIPVQIDIHGSQSKSVRREASADISSSDLYLPPVVSAPVFAKSLSCSSNALYTSSLFSKSPFFLGNTCT